MGMTISQLSASSRAESIPHSIVGDHRRQEPRIAPIERPRQKRDAVQRGSTFGFSQNLLCQTCTEVRCQRYPRSAITHAVVNAVSMLSQMRKCVEGIGDKAAPAVADPGGGELGKELAHLPMQTRRTGG